MSNVELTKDIIKGFVSSCLIHKFDDATTVPSFHEDMWELCCSKNPFVAMAAPRGHAKSTSITLSYTLATLLFKERKFVVIVSDTEAQASMFLGQLKQELQDNENIIELFGLMKDDKGQVKFEKDSETDVIVRMNDGHKFRVIAKGAEQKLRGLLWDSIRPDLLVLDDMENDEIVMNKERREKFRNWFYGALLPCRSKHGIVRYVGTILHMDSMLNRLMPPESDPKTITEGLKTYNTRRDRMWKTLLYRAHDNDFEQVLWPDRYDSAYFKSLKRDYDSQGLSDKYSQEYLNYPLDESNSFFKKSDFLALKEEDRKQALTYYITADLAISERERADWSVFMIAGMDAEGRIQIRNVIRERMDGLTISNTMLALQRTYQPLAFGVEETQISKAIAPFLNKAMIEQNTFINIYPLKPHRQDKMTRANSIQARMRAGAVKFDKTADWYLKLEDECLRFPRDRHDDQVDALAYIGLMLDKLIEAPTTTELEEQEYQDEMETSGLADIGRDGITGY